MHDFDAAIRLEPAGEHRFAGATNPRYANMVGPFGGTTCAVLLNAVLQHPQREGEPIALTVNFAGPVADGPFEVEARPVRTNRSTQHWTLQLTQDGPEGQPGQKATVAATATAVFATRRETWSAPEAAPPQDMPPAATLVRAPTAGRPTWTQCYDMRFATGDLPAVLDGQAQPHASSRVWVRDEPARPLDFASLAAICDSFFPRIFIRRGKFSPIGTVSLTTYFHADAVMLAAQAERHLLGTARALNYRNGYFDQSAEVWSDDGALLASSHQVVYYKA